MKNIDKKNSFIIDRLAKAISNYPKQSLAIVFLLFCLTLPGVLNIQSDYDVRGWFKKTDPLLEKFNEFRKTFGNDDNIMISLYNPNGVFNKETLSDIEKLTDEFWEVKNALRVESLSNYIYVRAEGEEIVSEELFSDVEKLTDADIENLKIISMKHKQIPGRMMSYDGKSVIFLIRLKRLFGENPNYQPIISQVNEIISPYKSKGYTFYQVGTAKVTETFREIAEKDLVRLIPLLNLLIFILLIYIFRNKSGVILPFVVIGLTIMITMGLSGYFNIKLNNLSGMVPTVLIAICLADTIHILSHYRNSTEVGDRSYLALKSNLLPTFLTTFSTMLGFFSLIFNELVPIQNFGLLCGIGSFVAWVLSLLIVAPCMELFFKNEIVPTRSGSRSKRFEYVSIISDLIINHYKKIVLIFCVVGFLGVYIGMKNEVNSNPFDYFSKETDLAQSNQFFKDSYKGFNGLDIVLDSGKEQGIHDPLFLKKVHKFHKWVDSLSYVNKSNSILNTLMELNQASHQGRSEYYTPPEQRELSAQLYLLYTLGLPAGSDSSNMVDTDQRLLRFNILWNIQNSKESLEEALKIQNKARDLGINAYATGQEYLFQRMNGHVVRGYFYSIGISLLCITLLMMFVLKSFKLGLISVLPNLVPIIFGSMVMKLMGRPVDVGTVLVSSVCFGIAVDDTIHFLTEFQYHEKKGLSFEECLKKTLSHSGSALIITTIILVIGFGVFAFAEFVPNFNFGVLSSFVLTIALLTDFLFLPALLLLIRSFNKTIKQ